MKIWKIYQDHITGYDTYDSAIVAAETIEEARKVHPDGPSGWKRKVGLTWCLDPDQVGAILIGEAEQNVPHGVILASFNAG